MSNAEILEKAVQKAIESGWLNGLRDADFEWLQIDQSWNLIGIDSDGNTVNNNWASSWEIIFNHDFAKALWGDGLIKVKGDMSVALAAGSFMTAWAYHLQQMVIADDPIKYLGDNIGIDETHS